MSLHDPFGSLKHKLWPKEGPWIKLTIWLSTTKSQESPWLPCVQVACDICWKDLDKGYNFYLDLTSIKGLHTKLWAPKVGIVPILGIPGLPLGHLGASPMAKHKVYKREGGGFSQVWAVVSLMSLCLPVAHPSTKSAITMH
jgi:hypothetical protein